ncbi:MAG: rhomboid family intramembrane serine protease [Marinilabiliaceae bacterium]|nr:rhomboid family intramembrane serine protease [Marinilabiliaceae bacterium]
MSIAIFFVKIFESVENTELTTLGIYPRRINTVFGVFLSPLIHGDWQHLLSNVPTLTVLTATLLFFYRGVAYRAFFLIYVVSGILLWFIGRNGWHVGASGVIYGLAAFLFFSGVIRNYMPLMAISLFVIFFYGSMVWGIFPFKLNLPYSWEAHLSGTIVGLVMAFILRKKGPQKVIKEWPDDDDDEFPYWEIEYK